MYYLTFFLDFEDNNVKVKKTNTRLNEAINTLESVAIEYIKQLQGEQQAVRCKQNKSKDQLLYDTGIKEGMYIETKDRTIILYEKKNIINEGKLWNTLVPVVEKIGQFGITEYNISSNSTSNTKTHYTGYTSSTPQNNNKYTDSNTSTSYNFMKELKSVIANQQFKLNPVSKH